MSSPFTEVGRLEIEVNRIERTLSSKVDNYKLEDVKHSISSLRSQIEVLQNNINDLQNDIQSLKQKELERESA